MSWLDRFKKASSDSTPAPPSQSRPRPVPALRRSSSPAPARQKAPARPSRGASTVYRSEYLSNEEQAERFVMGVNGLPTGKLVRERDRLLITPDRGGWVNPKSPVTARLGIYSFTIRGSDHYTSPLKAGRFTPGAQVRLVREPDNKFDSNAIAIHAWSGTRRSGYVNKANAKRIARRLDAGEDLVAIATRGSGAGIVGFVPQILVAERAVMEHLVSGLGIKLD